MSENGSSPVLRALGWGLVVVSALWLVLTGGCTLTFLVVLVAGAFGQGGPGSLSGLPAVLLLGAVGIGPGVVLFLVGRSLLKKTRRAGPPA